jgi:biopolymer transport protein ExbD
MALREFQSYRTLEKPDTQLEMNGVLSVLLFIFGLSLLGSRFVFSPGLEIAIPQVQNIDLQATAGILNLGLNGIIMFDNHLLKTEDLPAAIGHFLSTKKEPAKITLLVCIDRWVPFGFVAEVTDILRSADC